MANTTPEFDRPSSTAVPFIPTAGSGAEFREPTPTEWLVNHSLKYPKELAAPGPFEKWVLFEVRTGRHIGRGGVVNENVSKDTTVASAALYLPETALKSEIAIEYDTHDMGPFAGVLSEYTAQTGGEYISQLQTAVGNVAEAAADLVTGNFKQGAGEAVSGVSNAWNAVTNLTSNAIKDLINKNNSAEALQAALLNLASETAFGPNIAQAVGRRVNPRTDILFNHVGYRTHSFDFMMIPRNEQEAKTIDQIVHLFQYYGLPSYSPALKSGNATVAGFLLGFPYEFVITFWSEGRPNVHHINKIGRSVLRSVIVNHAAAGKPAFFKGSGSGEVYPAATSLSLSFQEVTLLGRDSEEINRAMNDANGTYDPNALRPVLPSNSTPPKKS
jgi:hypothetical protein